MERFSRVRPSKWQSHYSEEFKRMVVDEYLKGNVTLRELSKKYNIGNSRISYWLNDFGYQIKKAYFITVKDVNENETPMFVAPTQTSTTDTSLQKQLEDALLLAEGYKRMIEIAELEFKISIRKKSNTK
jgi:transposase-like protein